MNKENRMAKLKEICLNENPEMTGVKIFYKGEIKEFDAYKVPLNCLVYNQYNGRIASKVKTYEKQYRKIDAEMEEDIVTIEKFLWESRIDRNTDTIEDLINKGQLQPGIVTIDGIIADGNRRACLLNKVWREREIYRQKNRNVDKCKYFLTIILPEELDKPEMLKLETTIQMGEDEKVDYNPIEKYLKCSQLRDEGNYTVNDISEMMRIDKSKIKEYLEIKDLMDEYLTYMEYEGIYTMLEGREDHFINLNRSLKKFKGSKNNVEWSFDEDIDIGQLKAISFDFIRYTYEGKEFRNVAGTTKDAFFNDENVWENFVNNYFFESEKIKSLEKSVNELRIENPDSDITKLLNDRDKDWTEKIAPVIKRSVGIAARMVDDKNNANNPGELLDQIINTLNAINTDVESFYTIEISEKIKEINGVLWNFKKEIEKRLRKN